MHVLALLLAFLFFGFGFLFFLPHFDGNIYIVGTYETPVESQFIAQVGVFSNFLPAMPGCFFCHKFENIFQIIVVRQNCVSLSFRIGQKLNSL